MKPPGSFKIANRGRISDGWRDPLSCGAPRSQRIVDSIRAQVAEGGPGQSLRIRQVFRGPRELFRLELDLPEFGYQRTTLLDREALEELLATEEIRHLVEPSPLDR